MRSTLTTLVLIYCCLADPKNQVCAQWVQTNGPYAAQVTSVVLADSTLFAGTNDGVFVSNDYGDHWTQSKDGFTTSSVTALASIGSTVFAGTDGGVFLTTDHGSSWTPANYGLTDFSVSCLASKDSVLIAGTYTDVFLSTNMGKSWVSISPGLYAVDSEAYWNGGFSVKAVAIYDSTIYLGTADGFFVSTNWGSIWAEPSANSYSTPKYGWEIAVMARPEEERIFVSDGNGIYYSGNNGANWTYYDGPVKTSKGSINCLAVFDTTLLAGTPEGVYRSRQSGYSWTEVNEGFPAAGCDVTVIYAAAPTIFAGTVNSGIWLAPLQSTGITSRTPKVTTHFALLQNYPNPFNPSTVLTYRVPFFGDVRLDVYDILGRLVRTLVNQRQSVGEHSVTFDASNLPSGVYFYRLQAGTFMATKKLTVLK